MYCLLRKVESMKKGMFPRTTVEHINIMLKSARGISVNVCDLGFKSAENLVRSCTLCCRSTAQNVHRSMFVSGCRSPDWFDGQLRASSHFISKMHQNHNFLPKHYWTCKYAKKWVLSMVYHELCEWYWFSESEIRESKQKHKFQWCWPKE